ncbi:MAG: hypothetical protein ACQES0_00445 [Bacteroidota bacterium]
MHYLRILIYVFLMLTSVDIQAQKLVLHRSEPVSCAGGKYKLQAAPLVPGSFTLYDAENSKLAENLYTINHREGLVYLDDSICGESLYCTYRIFPYDFSGSITEQPWLFAPSSDSTSRPSSEPEIAYSPGDLRRSSTDESRLKTTGSIARGVSMGNRQNAVLNSNLNLQIEGELTSDLKVRASLTDRNIPIQPDGTSQKLQEFDKVFIEVYNDAFRMSAGDIVLKQQDDYFMRYAKKARGASLSGRFDAEKAEISSDFGASVSQGNYQRMKIQGEEGNQGPYKLQGNNNESYIVIVSGSERVYLDGELLTRGQTKDYIIDYNTGELSFTANRLITKDSRIIAEFEYRASSYNRLMLASNHEVKTKKSRFFVRYFHESDGKNQPVDQRLDIEQRQFLSNIGDELSDALYPAWDSVGFESAQVRYRLTDTVVNGEVYDSIFVHSTNPDSAFYQINFSNVGENQGNYIKVTGDANGRVFRWVAPVDGTPSGNYAPVSRLITPKKQQMLSMGGDYQLTNSTELFYMMSFSEKDVNTYSNQDAGDDKGLALRGGINQQLINDSLQNLRFSLAYDFIQRNFSSLERFREAEFTRNWIVENELAGVNEHAGQLRLQYDAFTFLKADFQSSVMYRPGEYSGGRQLLNASLRNRKWDVLLSGDLLNTRQTGYEGFLLKNNISLGKLFPKWQVFGRFKQEWQEGKIPDTGELTGNSFRFYELESWVKQGRQSDNEWKLSYLYRKDELPEQNRLTGSSEAYKLGMDYRLLKTKVNKLDAGLQYRKLDVLRQTEFEDTRAQDNFAGQLRYRHESFNGFLTGNLYYQSGSGLELKKEYSYLKVPEGQGIYTWTDYNGNGVEELDEFEEAVYQDQADYIRIYMPGNDYIKSFNNSLNFSLNLRPERVIDSNTGFYSVLAKLSNRFNMNLAGKNTASRAGVRYLPVSYLIPDTALVFYNNNLRNVLSWNRLSSVFTADIIYQRQDSRSQLVSGEESRESENWKLQWRWNVSREVSISNTTGLGSQFYYSQFFSNKNYHINEESNLLDIRVQPDVNVRLRGFFDFSHRKNILNDVFSRSLSPGVEYRNNALINGMLSVRLEYVWVMYSGETGTSLAWQMLESLQPGDNYRWNLSFQKRLSNGLQLNLNYQGRKPAGERTIHTGGVQLRAYF